jgi:hypothetical protein
MNRRLLSVLALLVGIVLVIVALTYWRTPAGSLPHYFPGYVEGATGKHMKHGLASFIVALGLFAYAWFQTGKK